MMRARLARIAENLLFAGSLVLLIPPVPSVGGQHYNFFPLGAVAIAAFAGGRLLAVRAKRETWLAAAFQTAAFAAFGWLIHERLQSN